MTQLTRQRAEQLLQAMRDRKIVVLGDVMLDEFVWGDVTRISPEAPCRLSIFVASRFTSVARRMCSQMSSHWARKPAWLAWSEMIRPGERLRRALEGGESATNDDYLVVDESRPSTTKTRIIAHSQLVVRADREQRTPGQRPN